MFEVKVTMDGETVSVDTYSIDDAAEVTSDFIDYSMDSGDSEVTIKVSEVKEDE